MIVVLVIHFGNTVHPTHFHTQKRFLVCVDWKTFCCAHQLTDKKEDVVSCWRWWSLFLELLFPAIVEYLSKSPKENTVFLRILIHSASFSWLFPMWLLAEWKCQEPSTSRKKRNKRNILKEKMFCKFNGLWQFGIALLSGAFFMTENILFPIFYSSQMSHWQSSFGNRKYHLFLCSWDSSSKW